MEFIILTDQIVKKKKRPLGTLRREILPLETKYLLPRRGIVDYTADIVFFFFLCGLKDK